MLVKAFGFHLVRLFWILLFGSQLLSHAQTFSNPSFSAEKLVALSPYRVVGLAFAPDGRIFIWQKDGVIRIMKKGALLPTPFLDLRAQVNNNGDRGLIGFAFDPNFSSNGYVYLAYVYENPNTAVKDDDVPRTQRVSRFQASSSNPDIGLPSSETVILGKITTDGCSGINEDCIPNDAHEHTIDSVVFAPDGKLFVSVGEGGSSTGTQIHSFRAQNLDILNGKLLRINNDGTAPGDNPFDDGNPNSNRSKVWALGLRNPYRFALHPVTAEPYIGDVGWYEWEEIDRGRGKNFGWPCFEGGVNSSGNFFSDPQSRYQADFPAECAQVPSSVVTAPLYAYSHNDGATVVASTFYTGNIYPAELKGNLFFGDYANKWIRRLILDASGNFAGVKTFATNVDGIVNIVQGPDGLLYYVSFTSGIIWKIKYSGALNRAPIAKVSATPTNGYSPLDVTFSSAGSSDPDRGALTYLWDFGDGSTSTNASPVHRYSPAGVQSFTATLTVKDSGGLTASDSAKITVGSKPPVASITSPADGTKANIGDVITFTGSASDPDEGNLPASALHWTELLHHNDHVHTVSETTGFSGSFTVENHDSVGTFSYEVILTATDSSGLADTKQVHIFPVIPAAPETDFSMAVTPTEQTIIRGNQASVSVQITPVNGFTGSIKLSCSGLPVGFVCTFSPSTVNITSEKSSSLLTISTTTNTAALLPFGGILMAGFLFPFLRFARKSQSRRLMLGLLSLVFCELLIACRDLATTSQTSHPDTQSQTYSVVIGAASSDKQHAATTILHVQ
jgi:glucose/arabinose dehydrogenase